MNTIAVVCSEFNKSLVESLYQTACVEFENSNKTAFDFKQWSLKQFWVPGAGEIPPVADELLRHGQAQALLALAVIIEGKTGHYDFLCQFLQRALWDLQKTYSTPIVFSILMLKNRDQAKDRMNRGKEGMRSLKKMIEFYHQ